MQSQIGASFAALGKALTLLLEEEEKEGVQTYRVDSDAGRMLGDLHKQKTKSRRGLLCLNFNKDLRGSLREIPIHLWLFGDNLAERIKPVKAIERSGSELKKKTMPKKTFPSALNSRGPPRQKRVGGEKYTHRRQSMDYHQRKVDHKSRFKRKESRQ
nr:unnamed protein product [Callosobruchus analis]